MSSTPPQPAINPEVAKLRANIARRKRKDRVFFAIGLSIVVISLGVLAVLFLNLLVSGWPALTQSYFTKSDGSGFGRNDLGGVVTRDGETWKLSIPLMTLSDLKDNDETRALVGKTVAVSGRVRGGEVPDVVVRTIAEAGPDNGGDVRGVLRRTESESTRVGETLQVNYTLEPELLTVDISNVPAEAMAGIASDSLAAFRVDGRVSDGSFKASDVAPLVRKNFFTSFPSREPKQAGILSAIVGTLCVMIVTMFATVPLGVAAGVYLEEYASKSRLTAIIEVNIANLAGVPSIIWGLMALGLFVYGVGYAYRDPPHMPDPAQATWYDRDGDGRITNPTFGRSIMTAGLTLGLLVLPIVIISTREAIRSIPGTIREASVALGATRWQTVRHHVLPYSLPGVLTGSILALSRAIGETAPLVTIGALTFIAFLPRSPLPPVVREVPQEVQAAYEAAVLSDPNTPPPQPQMRFVGDEWLWSEFTVMPIQLFQWVSRPQKEFHQNAAATGVVLLAMTLSLNGAAIYLRYRLRRNIKW